MNSDPSVLLACTALYRIVDPSLNTCTYLFFPLQTTESFSIQPLHLPTAFIFPLFFRSSDPPKFSSNAPFLASQHREVTVSGTTQVASVTQSGGLRTTHDVPAFLSADRVQVTLVPGGLISDLVDEKMKEKADSRECESV
jgi:hypothetical protein